MMNISKIPTFERKNLDWVLKSRKKKIKIILQNKKIESFLKLTPVSFMLRAVKKLPSIFSFKVKTSDYQITAFFDTLIEFKVSGNYRV